LKKGGLQAARPGHGALGSGDAQRARRHDRRATPPGGARTRAGRRGRVPQLGLPPNSQGRR